MVLKAMVRCGVTVHTIAHASTQLAEFVQNGEQTKLTQR